MMDDLNGNAAIVSGAARASRQLWPRSQDRQNVNLPMGRRLEADEIMAAMAILADVAYPTLRDAIITNPMIAEGARVSLVGAVRMTAASLHANSESTSKEQFYESLRRVSQQLS